MKVEISKKFDVFFPKNLLGIFLKYAIINKNYGRGENRMEKLTQEEVLHVAELARIEVEAEKLEKYSVELKQLLNGIDKIKDVEVAEDEILVTPTHHLASMREKDKIRNEKFEMIRKNLPLSVGKFVSVPVVIKND